MIWLMEWNTPPRSSTTSGLVSNPITRALKTMISTMNRSKAVAPVRRLQNSTMGILTPWAAGDMANRIFCDWRWLETGEQTRWY